MQKCALSLSLLAALLVFGVGVPEARASLGGRGESIDHDRLILKAQRHLTSVKGTQVHELTLANTTVVREYSRADGVVFAVSWQGPGRPNLEEIFGAYYPRFQADNSTAVRQHYRQALGSDHLDFIVRTGGHSGDFWGMAFLPMQAPSGFSPADMK